MFVKEMAEGVTISSFIISYDCEDCELYEQKHCTIQLDSLQKNASFPEHS